LKSLDDPYHENVTSEMWVILCKVLTGPAKDCIAHCKANATHFFLTTVKSEVYNTD